MVAGLGVPIFRVFTVVLKFVISGKGGIRWSIEDISEIIFLNSTKKRL